MTGTTQRAAAPETPKVAISACLLGESVRYDGGHKHTPGLLAALGPFVSFLPICPEVGAGYGTPREPIHVERRGGRLRLIGNTSGLDGTDAMETFARREIDRLRQAGIAGCVLKARSPSCGVRDVPQGGEAARADGRGVFATLLAEAMPELPMADDEQLGEPAGRERFLAQVRRAQERQGSAAPCP